MTTKRVQARAQNTHAQRPQNNNNNAKSNSTVDDSEAHNGLAQRRDPPTPARRAKTTTTTTTTTTRRPRVVARTTNATRTTTRTTTHTCLSPSNISCHRSKSRSSHFFFSDMASILIFSILLSSCSHSFSFLRVCARSLMPLVARPLRCAAASSSLKNVSPLSTFKCNSLNSGGYFTAYLPDCSCPMATTAPLRRRARLLFCWWVAGCGLVGGRAGAGEGENVRGTQWVVSPRHDGGRKRHTTKRKHTATASVSATQRGEGGADGLHCIAIQ